MLVKPTSDTAAVVLVVKRLNVAEYSVARAAGVV